MNATIRAVALLGAVLLPATPAAAQYFGRNKVQYETFKFQVLKTQHFDVYFYPNERPAAEQAARMAERWYTRLSSVLHHELKGKQPLILYADHPDFEQTNVLSDAPGEGTGGVTESLKRRIILPLGASLRESDHVIGHELVHAFQYDISGVGRGSMAGGFNRMPLWFVEGMAEYLSLGPIDPQTTMWMRDAVLRNDLPDLNDLANPRFFPYRYGQAFWAYLGGTFGDQVVGAALRVGAKSGDVARALASVTGQPADSLVADWHRQLRERAALVAQATRTELPPADRKAKRTEPMAMVAGAHRLIGGHGETQLNLAPALSPDGKRMVYFSEAGLLSIDMYLADAATGKTIRKLVSATRDPHLESLQFINSAGAWDLAGQRFVFGAILDGKPALRIVNGADGSNVKDIRFPTLGEIFNPTWSPDGQAIGFSAQVGGLSDLFIYDLGADKLQRVTNDAFADLEPAWSPDGRRIAFVTDRFGTGLTTLTYGNYRLATVDVQSGSITALPGIADAKHINPQWSPDGTALYFLSDPGGITNVFRLTLADGAITQVTNVYGGVAGITPLSPALSVAQRDGRAVFSVYVNDGYELHVMDDRAALAGGPITEPPAGAATLPPVRREPGILAVLANATAGLPASVARDTVKPYHAGFSLDLVAQPNVAVAADRFGTYLGGGVTLFWSDMLGDHNLVTMAQLNGRLEDFAGLVAYENRRSRWNWSIAAQQVPYITGAFAEYFQNVGGQTALVQEVERLRQTNRQLVAGVSYPFNRSQRFDLSAGVENISFSHELQRRAVLSNGSVAFDSTIDFAVPGSLNLGVGSAALVHDNAYFGATGPILGDRWRLEVAPTIGTLHFTQALVDYRRYIMPLRPFTLAGRVLHVGRYGGGADDQRIFPLFLGYPSLVRGYDQNSFETSECGTGAGCPVFDQLLGSRIIVANAELRFPPFGLLRLGGGYYGVLPLEAAIFYDAGVAWTGSEGAAIFGNGPRHLVRSAGVSLRLNLLGFAIGQLDFAHPFDRPQKNWMIRLSLTEGF
jgi:Tol biopolymer transport system component